MDKIIEEIVKEDEVLNFHYKNISEIKGIAMLSFAVIAAETNGFVLFKDAGSLVSYAGYDVVENQSGKPCRSDQDLQKRKFKDKKNPTYASTMRCS